MTDDVAYWEDAPDRHSRGGNQLHKSRHPVSPPTAPYGTLLWAIQNGLYRRRGIPLGSYDERRVAILRKLAKSHASLFLFDLTEKQLSDLHNDRAPWSMLLAYARAAKKDAVESFKEAVCQS